jgi:site-specific recombinase XerD
LTNKGFFFSFLSSFQVLEGTQEKLRASLPENTWRAYNAGWMHYNAFASEMLMNPYERITLNEAERRMESFICWCLSGGLSVETTKHARSAMSTLFAFALNVRPVQTERTRAMISGAERLQPKRSRLPSIFDPQIVTRYIDSLGVNSQLPQGVLTAKVIVQLLLMAAVRFTEQLSIELQET